MVGQLITITSRLHRSPFDVFFNFNEGDTIIFVGNMDRVSPQLIAASIPLGIDFKPTEVDSFLNCAVFDDSLSHPLPCGIVLVKCLIGVRSDVELHFHQLVAKIPFHLGKVRQPFYVAVRVMGDLAAFIFTRRGTACFKARLWVMPDVV
jgi:hypothetical protein